MGSQHYKDLLRKLKEVGVGNSYPLLLQAEWRFTHDQWEVQRWEQVFQKIGGENNLIYCTTNIPSETLSTLPGVSGYQFATYSPANITTMLQQVINHCVLQKENPSMAFLREGPYLVLREK